MYLKRRTVSQDCKVILYVLYKLAERNKNKKRTYIYVSDERKLQYYEERVTIL